MGWSDEKLFFLFLFLFFFLFLLYGKGALRRFLDYFVIYSLLGH
jgi:hypothetical protein